MTYKGLTSDDTGLDILNWVDNYLCNMLKYVNIKSEAITVLSALPQGSHFYPLLFNLFINDLSNAVSNNKHLKFANDLKIFGAVSNETDVQEDLNRLSC